MKREDMRGNCRTPEHRRTFFNYKAAKQQAACFVCGEDDYNKIEYHHICYDDSHGQKLTDKWLAVSTMVRQNYAWEDVKAEMDKCLPLCKTCHAEYHRKLGA